MTTNKFHSNLTIVDLEVRTDIINDVLSLHSESLSNLVCRIKELEDDTRERLNELEKMVSHRLNT